MAPRKKTVTNAADLAETGVRKTASAVTATEEAAEAAGALAALRDELEGLRARVSDLQSRATTAVRSGASWADEQAHERLGAHPWAKIAGAAVLTVAVTKLVRLLPFGGIAAVAAPLVIEKLTERKQSNGRW